ncbi:hypothetical protein [Halobacillus sp. A5]|uniref:hypothetical protein n=1 Tax=Halobacillus sp. A5 TaxID=2880263 RepID=UPI0020A69F65|nr:hypothetical protein [Halobacillus sp. A5]MCP3027175.1 hypothetical protein [Halobacillus sp. A5]
MKEWLESKRTVMRARRKGDLSPGTFFADLLSWFPQLLILPFRILMWLFKGLRNW